MLGSASLGVSTPAPLETRFDFGKNPLFEGQARVRVGRGQLEKKVKEGLQRFGPPLGTHAVVEGKLIVKDEDAQIGQFHSVIAEPAKEDMEGLSLVADYKRRCVRNVSYRDVAPLGHRPEGGLRVELTSFEEDGEGLFEMARRGEVDAYVVETAVVYFEKVPQFVPEPRHACAA